MNAPRETIYATLFEKIGAIDGIAMASRRLVDISQLAASDMPAIFQHQESEVIGQVKRGLPSIWTLRVHLYLYASGKGDRKEPASSVLNPILDDLVRFLMPEPPENEQTLGGLVQWCRIYSEIVMHEGTESDQMVALIPVEMLTT